MLPPKRAAQLLAKVRGLLGAQREVLALELELLDDMAELLAKAERSMNERAIARSRTRRRA